MRALAVLLFVLPLASCNSGSTEGAAAPEGWVKEVNPSGFVVSHPKGWTVSAGSDGLIVVERGDKAARAVVQPFLLARPTSAEQWLANVPALFAPLFPGAKIESTRRRQARPDEMFASMTYGDRGRANLLCSIDGSSGMFYAVAAPGPEFAAEKETLVKVLKTFSFTQPSAPAKQAAAAPQVQWVEWKDPREDAFSLNVPRGWAVQGGMFHRNAVDPRAAIAVTSPDGKICITGGDVDVPSFTLPTPLLAQTGFPEGATYSPGYGVNMVVSRYMPGPAFPKWYVTAKLPKDYTGLTFTDARDRDDAVKAINDLYARLSAVGITSKLSAGEVAFTCTKGSEPWRGYYFASTRMTAGFGGGGGVWMMESLFGYMAAAGREKEAQALLSDMVKSFHLNPAWVARQQKMTADVSKIVSSTHEEISKIIDDTYWSRQASQDNLSRKWSNTILGQTDVVDPETGEKWKVSSGHNYYWRKENTDAVVGTDTYERPDTDFAPLAEW